MNLSAAASRQATANQLKGYQVMTMDVLLFSQYMNARSGSNDALAKFYSDRFRNEAKVAFQAWLTTHPFENPSAQPHPFVTNFYKPSFLSEADVNESESQRLWQFAGNSGRNGRGYVLITVLLASALFCAGVAPKFDVLWMRRTVLALGLCVILFAIARLCVLPVQL